MLIECPVERRPSWQVKFTKFQNPAFPKSKIHLLVRQLYSYPKLERMKNLLLAATAVGVATAGLLLYLSRQQKMSSLNANDTAEEARQLMDESLGAPEMRGQHAMG